MKNKIAMFGMLAVLAGCNLGCALLGAKPACEPVKMWEKEGATQEEFFTAKTMCVIQSQFNSPESGPGINWESFNACMKAFGFSPVQE